MARALGWPRLAAAGALGLALALPALLQGSYALHLLVLSALWAILAVSFNVIAGYRGLLSLVHVAFFAVGAYVSGLGTLRLGLSFWLALPLAGAAAVASALAIGWVVLRMPVHAFIIASVAVAVIVNLVLLNWVEVTNGPMGLAGVMPPRLALGALEVDFTDRTAYYYLVLVVMVVVGGRATLAGPLLGAALFIFLPETLRLTKGYRNSVIGLTLMLTVRFLPEGIVGATRESWRRLSRRRAGARVGDEPRADHAATGSPRAQ